MKRALAWFLLIGAIIGWPVTQFTVARDEPPFILALSWLAIILTALDGVWIVKKDEEE
jgi:hypothetical protein